MKKARAKKGINRTNQSWNNQFLPSTNSKQKYQTNYNNFGQRTSNKNKIDPNDKYDLRFINSEKDFFKKQELKSSNRFNFQRNKSQNKNSSYDTKNKENNVSNKADIKREQISSMSRDEFFKKLYSIRKDNEEENDSIKSFIENVRKKRNPNKPSLADYLESKKFVELNKKEILKKINKYTNDNISDEELIEAQIKNPDNHKRRNDLIEETCEKY